MARVKVVMPQMGESITTGTITKWHKKPGDMIAIDEMLFEISTEKVESEIPSSIEGRIEALLYKEGDTVDVGKVIAEIEDDPQNAAATVSVIPAVVVTTERGDGGSFTPLVKAMAKKAGVALSELAQVKGSGAGGRVTKDDFENYVATRSAPKAQVKLEQVQQVQQVQLPPTPSTSASDRVTIIPMDNMRKAIARNMVASKLTSPHVNSVSEVDLSHLVRFREKAKNEFEKQEGFKLTYTPFIMWAITKALKDFPKVNASVEGDNIVLRKDINLGVAVSVGGGEGLIVPIIKNADTLSLLGLCRSLHTMANKARQKKLTLDELQGGTFTLTNVGGFGTLLATPVILQPQVGIYAAGAIQKRAVVVSGPQGDDMIAIRSMMYGTHTYDHRLVDGEMGGRFLEAIHDYLRKMDPELLLKS